MIGPELQVRLMALEPTRAKLRIQYSTPGGGIVVGENSDRWMTEHEVLALREGIACELVQIRPDRVRLGVRAPREVAVHRTEVYEAKCARGGSIGDAGEPGQQ